MSDTSRREERSIPLLFLNKGIFTAWEAEKEGRERILEERVCWAGSTNWREGTEALGRGSSLARAVCPTLLCRIGKQPLWNLAVG